MIEIVSKLKSSLQYILPKIEIINYWREKERLSREEKALELETLHYTVMNVLSYLHKWLTKWYSRGGAEPQKMSIM